MGKQVKKEANSMRIKATSRKCLYIKYCAKVIQKIIVDLAIITSREVIIAGSQSFKIGCHTLCQGGKRKKVINATEEYSIAKTTKDATEFDETLFKSKVYSFC